MTYKQKALKAWRKLENKYRNVTEENYRSDFFKDNKCPLCKIYDTGDDCDGCPLSDEDKHVGCVDFASYKIAKEAYREAYYLSVGDFKKAYSKRADFFKKYYPVLEKLPAKKFTPTGWSYFEELDRED